MAKKIIIDRQWFITSKVNNIHSDYLFMNEIGSGAYGKIFLAKDRLSGCLRAIKVIQKVRIDLYDTFVTEITILKSLDHPNIVNIIETYENESTCFIVLEHCNGGELFERLIKFKTFSEVEACSIMKQLVSAVNYCHSHKIVHRDMKPENCLFISNETDELKIIDFGLSARVTESELLHGIQGTPYYMAPELLSNNYDKQVDLWSLGVIMYMLLSGTPPFNGSDNREILMNVLNGCVSFRYKIFKKVSNSAKDLICKLLTKDPEHRITAAQALDHLWMKGSSTPVNILPSSITESLKKFHEANALKRASFMYIATKLTDNSIKSFRNHFQSIDINGKGFISRIELEDTLRKDQDISEDYIKSIVSSLDANNNGNIDYSEFLTGCLLRKCFTTSGFLESAFKYFDKDCSGFITASEIRSVFYEGEVITDVSEESVNEIILSIDKNSDGLIDYHEFIEMMTQKSLCSPT